MSIKDNLVVNDGDAYGDLHAAHCMEIYKLYVQMADKISARRQAANSYFLAINTTVVGFVGYIGTTSQDWLWIVSVAGLLLCFIWYRLVRSYKDLNTGKFKVVHEIEQLLPLAPYDAEWEALGRGKKPELYLPFTHVEKYVPLVFAGLHALTILAAAGVPAFWTS